MRTIRAVRWFRCSSCLAYGENPSHSEGCNEKMEPIAPRLTATGVCEMDGGKIVAAHKPYLRPKLNRERSRIKNANIAVWCECENDHFCLFTIPVDEPQEYNVGRTVKAIAKAGPYMEDIDENQYKYVLMYLGLEDWEEETVPELSKETAKKLLQNIQQLVGVKKKLSKTIEPDKQFTLRQQIKGLEKRFDKLMLEPGVDREWWNQQYRTMSGENNDEG